MKKYFVLTSILALAACGGGSGSGSDGYNPVDVIRAGTTGTVSLEAAESNYKVTSMVSEIGQASDGSTINIVNSGRSATTSFVYNGKEYRSYRLDDVRFGLGPSNGEVSEDEYITFGLNPNTGEIDSVIYHDGDEVSNVARESDTNVFTATVYKYYLNGQPMTDSFDTQPTKEQVLNAIEKRLMNSSEDVRMHYLNMFEALGEDWDSEEHLVSEVQKHTFELKGKDLDVQLRYSDFGYDKLVTVGEEDEPDNSVIAGGYDIKKIDVTRPEFADKKITFSGTAIGAKSYNEGTTYISETIDTDKGAATLTFENGHETLIMPFNDYYTVTVNKDGENSNIAFTDYKGSNDNFKFTKENNITTNSDDYAFVNIKYFGDNNQPSEAIGTVHYEEDGGKYPAFEGAFGMTKDK